MFIHMVILQLDVGCVSLSKSTLVLDGEVSTYLQIPFTLHGLEACRSYNVSLEIINNQGYRTNSSTVLFQTGPIDGEMSL